MKLFSAFKKNRASVPHTSGDTPKRAGFLFPQYSISFRDAEKPHIPYYRDVYMNFDWRIAPMDGTLYYDPIEDYPVFKSIIQEVDAMVDAQLGDMKGRLGSCHAAWSIKKRLLREYYGLEWHSPQEMNPSCHFD